ncbi:AAA family ATPase [Candidatus Uhrbacteria bacterium]|nr:AAA family ATPase [Candidatus Uhrbacteria bacterium]
MLKRFQKITQTGVFRKADGLGKFEFGKTVVFYGLNTFGKTTLKDIFNSLACNNPDHITKRKSIPADTTTQQEVILCCMDGKTEKPYRFTTAGWDCTDLQGKIFVFDNDFIHRNVITGFRIERENKEALSDFILGEQGVKLSEEIREMKETVRTKRTTLKTPSYFTKLTTDAERERFVQLKVTEDKAVLEALIATKKQDVSNYANQSQIAALPDITVPTFGLEVKLTDIISKLNVEFAKDFKDVTKETLDAISAHTTKCITGGGSQSWIKQGLKYKKADDCPFCGQAIAGDAKKLLDAYHAYFNQNYERFASTISQNLSSAENAVNGLSVNVHAGFLQAQVSLQKYKAFDSAIETELILDELKRLETEVNTKLTAWKNTVKDAVEKKNKEPHAALSDMTLGTDLTVSISAFSTELKKQTTRTEVLITKAKKLKENHAKLTPAQVSTEQADAHKTIRIVEEKIARLDQDADCVERVRQQGEIQKLEKDIVTKTQELETQQSGYISKYFTELNSIYSQLGSGDFVLQSSTNNRGDKKIYELKVSYKGANVEHQDISKVMSESDKRSLAFAIFLTKLKYQTNKADLMVVLDDPVVSFDDNRISISVDIVKQLSNDFKQLLILTHYPPLVKKMVQTKADAGYFRIHKNDQTSTFEPLNTDEFVLSDYEQAFEKIYSFIERKHTDDITKDLRVYLEKYLQVAYQKNIRDQQVTTSPLKNFINDLHTKGVITDQQKTELHQFRESLNPDHHQFVGNSNEEDRRTYATNLLNYLSNL